MILESLLFAVYFLVPFLGGNDLTLPGVTIDRFWMETVFLLLLIGTTVFTFLSNKTVSGFARFIAFFLPFFAVCTLSTTYTWNLYNTVREVNLLVCAAGAVYLFYITRDKDIALQGLVWGCVALVGCAVLQFKVVFPQLSAALRDTGYAWMMAERSVPFAAFVNENMLGGYLVLVLPLSLYFAFDKGKKRHIASTLIIIGGILFSLSRLSAIVMSLELLGACVVVVRRYGWRRLVVLCGCCAAGFVLFLGVILTPAGGGEKQMHVALQDKTSTAIQRAKTLHFRTEIWKGGGRAFAKKPLLGYGAGSFEYPFKRHFDGLLYTRYSHGSIVKIAVETGLAGLCAFAWYLLGVGLGMAAFWRRYALPAMAVAGGFLFSLVDCALDTSAFVITFFVLSSVFLFKEGPDGPVHRARSSSLFLAVLVLIVVSFAFTARAGLAKKSIEVGLLCEESGLVGQAYSVYRESSGVMPLDNESLIGEIRLLTMFLVNERDPAARSELSAALDRCLEKAAAKRDKDSELFFVSALACRAQGANDKSFEYVTKAIELYPSSPYYVSLAVKWYIEKGDLAQASALIDRFEPYVPNIKRAGNPYGLYVYRLRELQAEIAAQREDFSSALAIARKNLLSATSNEFIITSHKTREYVQKEWLVRYLTEKVNSYEIRARKLH